MLFNSPLFLFLFLPLSLLIFYGLKRLSWKAALFSLALESIVFYCSWNWQTSWYLAVSILGNYALGLVLLRWRTTRWGGPILTLGCSLNLAALWYFKYALFTMTELNHLLATHYTLAAIVLPLGISFFTFTQIAYLVDVRRQVASEPSFLNYVLFVTFFPHLIAGPIIHHKEMMPQFQTPKGQIGPDLAVGTALFTIGLVKKVLLADLASTHVGPVFAHTGNAVSLIMAWEAALNYTAQIYFDFSGYSDMALGLSRMFGIDLPINFNSPYKSCSIIEFWRRWHMTLSRFLRDYLYFPLGGNRKGILLRYGNLMVVMLLGGLWHGANWTFLAWGFVHGFGLMINHLWRNFKLPTPPRSMGLILTLLTVTCGWVLFRAPNITTAWSILQSMAGLHGLGHDPLTGIGLGIGLLALAVTAPNSQQIMRHYNVGLKPILAGFPHWLVWRPNAYWAVTLGGAGIWAIMNLWSSSEFLYYQF